MGSSQKIINEITELLSTLNPEKVLMFGSVVTGKQTEDSDIDLLVILNDNNISKSFDEKIKKKMKVSRILRSVRKKKPIDILVYSKKEWELLRKSGASFFKQIDETSVKLI